MGIVFSVPVYWSAACVAAGLNLGGATLGGLVRLRAWATGSLAHPLETAWACQS